jgi:pilus assembly protein CpaE
MVSEKMAINDILGSTILKIQADASVTHHVGHMSMVNGLAKDVDIAFLDCKEGSLEHLEQLARFLASHPGVVPIVLASNPSSAFLLSALRSGVKEIIHRPDDEQEMAQALGRMRHSGALNTSKPATKVLSVVSCKGGAGATFIATNLAYGLAEKRGLKVLLIDLNLQFGDAALFLSNSKANAGLAEIVKDLSRLDLALIESSTVNPLPNLSIIAASEDPTQSTDVTARHIDALLNCVRPHFDIVILDVGRSLDAVSIKAMDHSDFIFPVLQLTLPFVRDAKRLLEVFRSLEYPQSKIKPIVNRWEKSEDLGIPELESVMGISVHHVMPNHYKSVSHSINQGVPILTSAPTGVVAKSLEKLIQTVSSDQTVQNGWLDRLWKRG